MKTSLVAILFATFLTACPAKTTTVEQPGGGTGNTTDGTGGDPYGGAAQNGGDDLPGRGEECPDSVCAEGMECLTYYGIAGMSGPEFTSCETPCKDGKSCPEGLQCMTIADGPGQVCR